VREIEHHVFASSFADPADVAAFHKWFAIYKRTGMSDAVATQAAFHKGDNGIGCWGDDCTGPVPMCALPPEDMIERWGSVAAAKHKQVIVAASLRDSPPITVICTLADRMPHRANIANGAHIDLSPAAVAALGLKPPLMLRAAWKWA
jgi:hypothetical protein